MQKKATWNCMCVCVCVCVCVYICLYYISSVESQKGVIAVQRCFVENQKGAIAIDFVQQ